MRPILFAASLLALSSVAVPAAAPPWAEILGPRQGAVPAAAAFKPTWRGDLNSALKEAQQENRPLFVTMRCLPCKQCADFDKEVLEGGPDLDPILTQFITVRLTDARAIDLRLFPVEGFQDLDLSWWGWLLSPHGHIYAIYGGKDHVSDSTRISKASLIRTLNEVLKYHYDPRRRMWNLDGPAPDLNSALRSPTQLPGYASWKSKAPPKAMDHQGQT
ncbi:MAG: thioredoxin family protein, partial [Verrucomicrobiota bacterium]